MSNFIYLLNAMENAAREERPADHDYAGKRRAVLDHVAALEQQPRAAVQEGSTQVLNILIEFLSGSGVLDGKKFGDPERDATGSVNPFWWRRYLPYALDTAPPPPAEPAGEGAPADWEAVMNRAYNRIGVGQGVHALNAIVDEQRELIKPHLDYVADQLALLGDGVVPDDWTPTAENIAALPAPVRRYIQDLHTNCDPAGIIAENVLTRDAMAGLQIMYRKAVDAGGVVANGWRLVPTREKLKELLVVGAQIKLGEEYCARHHGYTAGEIITLVEGEFEYDNGLYTEEQYCASHWNAEAEEFDSIFHLFENDLSGFMDCEIINAAPPPPAVPAGGVVLTSEQIRACRVAADKGVAQYRHSSWEDIFEAELRALLSAQQQPETGIPGSEQPQPSAAIPWDNFPAYLIDCHEGDIISEELLQQALADMLKNPRYAAQQQPDQTDSSTMEKLRLLVAAANRIAFEADEVEAPDGQSVAILMDPWTEFQEALDDVNEAQPQPEVGP